MLYANKIFYVRHIFEHYHHSYYSWNIRAARENLQYLYRKPGWGQDNQQLPHKASILQVLDWRVGNTLVTFLFCYPYDLFIFNVNVFDNNFATCICWFFCVGVMYFRWIWCLWCYSECISTPGKLEKYAWPRWESDLTPLILFELWSVELDII
jgi:hypothetical protein